MSDLDVHSLGAVLSLGVANNTDLTEDYESVIAEMAHVGWESITRVDYIQPVVDQATYSYPSAAIVLTHLRYDTRPMVPLRWADFNVVGDGLWQERVGDPIAWTTHGVPERQFRVYPTPERTGPTLAGHTPYTKHIERTLTVVSLADGDEPAYETLWVTLDCLARQTERDAKHGDQAWAEACRTVARGLRDVLLAATTTAK